MQADILTNGLLVGLVEEDVVIMLFLEEAEVGEHDGEESKGYEASEEEQSHGELFRLEHDRILSCQLCTRGLPLRKALTTGLSLPCISSGVPVK